MNRLKDKVIVVTGGNGLLGKEIVSKAIDQGAICINADINHPASDDPTKVICDVTDPVSVEKTVASIIERYGRIDGLVNNAYPRTKDWGNKFEDINYESWKTNVDWQLNSYFSFTKEVSKYMATARSGAIVNMASIYGVVGPDFSVYNGTTMTMPAAYAAIKGGLINLTRYLASYLGSQNIRVNAVSPGGIFDNQNRTFVENYSNKVPLRRMGLPDDISPAVIFLLSDESKYITGHNLIVDGGWTSI